MDNSESREHGRDKMNDLEQVNERLTERNKELYRQLTKALNELVEARNEIDRLKVFEDRQYEESEALYSEYQEWKERQPARFTPDGTAIEEGK